MPHLHKRTGFLLIAWRHEMLSDQRIDALPKLWTDLVDRFQTRGREQPQLSRVLRLPVSAVGVEAGAPRRLQAHLGDPGQQLGELRGLCCQPAEDFGQRSGLEGQQIANHATQEATALIKGCLVQRDCKPVGDGHC